MQTLQRKNVTTPNYIIYIIQTSKRCHQYNIEHYEQTANIVAVRVRFGNSSAHNIEFPTARRSSPFRKGDGTQLVGVNHFYCYALRKNALKSCRIGCILIVILILILCKRFVRRRIFGF